MRVDQQLKMLPELVTSVRKSGLTIAVEAASERLREIINKPLKDEDLFAAVEAAYKAGWQKLKLYFMVGLPGETEEDIKQIVESIISIGKTSQKKLTVKRLNQYYHKLACPQAAHAVRLARPKAKDIFRAGKTIDTR